MTPFASIPPLAGLGTLAEAAKPGLAIDEAVRRLKRLHYAFRRLHAIFTARLTAEPIYELKTAFAHHAYVCAEHATAFAVRVGEMREPPLGLDVVPHEGLALFFDEILASPTTPALVAGLYASALSAVDAALAGYVRDTNLLTDAPSVRVCRFARLEVADMLTFGRQATAALEAVADPFLAACLDSAGGMDGVAPQSIVPERRTPIYSYDPLPQRDARFRDPYNQGVNPEAFLYDPTMPANAKALMMLYKRIREIDVPEMMAGIITQTTGKPWEYYRALTRQMWDEARHAMMGEVGFVALGIDWTQARISFNWSMRLNTECTPLERHAVLYFIEQGLMPRTGKRYEYEVATESGIPLMATIQDFDWADEVLHAAIGRTWYIPEFGHIKKALDFGDACWSRILSNWSQVRERGLTQHENWWPAIYLQACRTWNETPDPHVLAYATTYEGKRADLKDVRVSAGG